MYEECNRCCYRGRDGEVEVKLVDTLSLVRSLVMNLRGVNISANAEERHVGHVPTIPRFLVEELLNGKRE